MNTCVRVGIADDDVEASQVVQQMLVSLGHQVVFVAHTGRELVHQCEVRKPALVVTDIRMPDMDGLEAAKIIYEKAATPVILLSGYSDRETIDRAGENHVLAYLVKPVTQPQLEAAVMLVMHRYEEFKALERETAGLRQALGERKIVERAKGIMMKQLKISESEAFARLQRLAASKNKRLVEIAETVIKATEVLAAVDPKPAAPAPRSRTARSRRR